MRRYIVVLYTKNGHSVLTVGRNCQVDFCRSTAYRHAKDMRERGGYEKVTVEQL